MCSQGGRARGREEEEKEGWSDICLRWACSKRGRREIRKRGGKKGKCGEKKREVWHLCRNDSKGRDDREILMTLVEEF